MMNLRNKTRHLVVATVVAASMSVALVGCSNSAGTPVSTDKTPTAAAGPFDQALHDSLPEAIKAAGEIKAGSPTQNAPYIFLDGTTPAGIIPGLAEEVGKVLGVKVTFVDMKFPGLVPALQSQKIDIIWSVMNDNPEREKTLDFVNFIRTSSSLVVPKGNPKGIKSISDLCGNSIGTLRGSEQSALVETQNTKCTAAGKAAIDLKLYDDGGVVQTQLRAGQIDASFKGTAAANYAVAQGDETDVIKGETYLGGAFGIAVPKTETDLSAALQAAIKKTVESGAYLKILTQFSDSGDALTAEQILINGVGAGKFNK